MLGNLSTTVLLLAASLVSVCATPLDTTDTSLMQRQEDETPPGPQESGFLATCDRATIRLGDEDGTQIFNRYTLKADCYTFDGKRRSSEMNLQLCFANYSGTMLPRYL